MGAIDSQIQVPTPESVLDGEKDHPPSDGTASLAQALTPWRGHGRRLWLVKVLLLLVDAAVLWGCFVASRAVAWAYHQTGFLQGMVNWWEAYGLVRTQVFAFVSVAAILWLGSVYGHYTVSRRRPWWDETRQLLIVIVFGAMADAMFMYLGKWQFSRLATGSTWVLILVTLPLARLAVQHWLTRLGWLAQPYVLVGAPGPAKEAAAALASEPLMGYRPVALVCPVEHLTGSVSLAGSSFHPVAYTTAVRDYLAQPGPYHVVIALDQTNDAWLRALAQELMLTRDDVVLAPTLNGLPLLGMEISHFFSHDVLLLKARNNLHRRGPQLLKRLFDLVAASMLLVLALPLMLWVAWRIKQEDGGPVFYVHPRVGKGGRPFPFFKFRSMVLDADAALEQWRVAHPDLWAQYRQNNFKLVNDPRVTRIGRWIRRTSIDELPQLLNVLRGEMSLVGPRPLLARELPDYGPAIASYGMAQPGITGLWQISGRSSSSFAHRIDMDLWYTRNWSLWYDFVILVRTVRVVLRQEGAV